ncbi:hypothetical protein GOY07_01720 [Wolbachia endosymbiont of Litomosoides sigmodontis]|uniref:hypothetical protein n=1 Tax=Wolbachia endosymbiont of Litomosoides sigmodontis TaxID=80850 RepID=UPI00158B9ED6|nr:hypothetical protein [Wolbachia endosymbiont of Litomosoides sigmodontis]QKX02926.1 hypothetical protein GOY07_01720 [Wolbachia endosymbiont of Litomosoides sigmodontis]
MLETLKKVGADFILKVKDLFTPYESQVYVKDLRKVMIYKDGQKFRYPKNYDRIVKFGKIIENIDMHGNPVLDKDKNPTYKLLYGNKNKDGWPFFELTKVTEIGDKSYFTIRFLIDKGKISGDKRSNDDYRGFYELFGFSRIDLEKDLPIFEAQKTKKSTYSFEFTNSSMSTKEVRDNRSNGVKEVVDEKGKNGELLYISDYKRLNTSFFEIRDQSNNLELDKSIISVPVIFAAGLAKICAKLLTYVPMELGEYLIGKQNLVAKFFGYFFLFTPAVIVKNSVNILATLLKVPICILVANKDKYSDAYWTMWKYQLKECCRKAKGDYLVIKDGKRSELEKRDYPIREIVDTWKELDAKRSILEEELEGELSKHDESMANPGKQERDLEQNTTQPGTFKQGKISYVNKLNEEREQDKSVLRICS